MEGPKIGHCKAETARRGRSAGDNLPALTMAGYERQVKEMAVTLSSQEVAALTGKTERTVRRWAEIGKIPAERVLNKFNSPEYLFSLDALEPHLQKKYFDGLKLTPSPEVAQTLTKEAKPLDTYSIEEQEEIAFWLRLVKQWQGYRNKPGANKTEVDANFVQWCKLEYPERAISVDTLYRRWNAVRDNDLDGLIDKRGKWKKGKSSIPDPMWQAFLYFYLDERQHPLKKCYEYTKLEMQTSFPELVGDMPSYTTFYRRAQADIPEPLKVLGREGEKAFRDRCAPYIRRVYDDMRSNEWWIADNHTFDIITEGENGQRHRLYLTAFFDARSGIFTGCYVTNAPSSQSTLIALRRGILKYGIPVNIYVDNGREFLTYDVGGLGHRKKKPKDGQERFEPPPVFERLGIHMTNAIVRNAKAKIIERRFRDVKDHLSRLFDTFTGGNVLEKPESLKFILKDGRIPLDSTRGGQRPRQAPPAGLQRESAHQAGGQRRGFEPDADAEQPGAEGHAPGRTSGHCGTAYRLLERRAGVQLPGPAGLLSLRPGRSERGTGVRSARPLHHDRPRRQHGGADLWGQQGGSQGGHGQGAAHGAHYQGGQEGQHLPGLRAAHGAGAGHGSRPREQGCPDRPRRIPEGIGAAAA